MAKSESSSDSESSRGREGSLSSTSSPSSSSSGPAGRDKKRISQQQQRGRTSNRQRQREVSSDSSDSSRSRSRGRSSSRSRSRSRGREASPPYRHSRHSRRQPEQNYYQRTDNYRERRDNFYHNNRYRNDHGRDFAYDRQQFSDRSYRHQQQYEGRGRPPFQPRSRYYQQFNNNNNYDRYRQPHQSPYRRSFDYPPGRNNRHFDDGRWQGQGQGYDARYDQGQGQGQDYRYDSRYNQGQGQQRGEQRSPPVDNAGYKYRGREDEGVEKVERTPLMDDVDLQQKHREKSSSDLNQEHESEDWEIPPKKVTKHRRLDAEDEDDILRNEGRDFERSMPPGYGEKMQGKNSSFQYNEQNQISQQIGDGGNVGELKNSKENTKEQNYTQKQVDQDLVQLKNIKDISRVKQSETFQSEQSEIRLAKLQLDKERQNNISVKNLQYNSNIKDDDDVQIFQEKLRRSLTPIHGDLVNDKSRLQRENNREPSQNFQATPSKKQSNRYSQFKDDLKDQFDINESKYDRRKEETYKNNYDEYQYKEKYNSRSGINNTERWGYRGYKEEQNMVEDDDDDERGDRVRGGDQRKRNRGTPLVEDEYSQGDRKKRSRGAIDDYAEDNDGNISYKSGTKYRSRIENDYPSNEKNQNFRINEDRQRRYRSNRNRDEFRESTPNQKFSPQNNDFRTKDSQRYSRRRNDENNHPNNEEKVAKIRAEEAEEKEKKIKEQTKPNFGLSGKLAEETNVVKGVVQKYQEPPEAARPQLKWRFYVFKNDDIIGDPIPLHRQSCYIFGRERAACDVPIDHPMCSKQHAVLQFRKKGDGTIKPYVMDLKSANGTLLNGEKIEAERYYELMERDMLKFGLSTREYVLLHEQSQA